MVSLPASWVKERKLSKGDVVHIELDNSHVLISADNASGEKKKTSIDAASQSIEVLQVLITHAYREGVDIITIKSVTSEIMKSIRSVVTTLLLGFEITNTQSNVCVIENLSEPSDNQYDPILRRLFLLIKEMVSLMQKDFVTAIYDNAEEIAAMKNQFDKFNLFCRRLLHKEVLPNAEHQLLLLSSLMQIAHNFDYLYTFALTKKVTVDKDVKDLLIHTQKYFDLLYTAYYKKDISLINTINQLKTKYQFGVCLEKIEKGSNAVLFSYLREIFRAIQLGSSPVLSILLDKE
jgi:phosphate uptake regulator